MTRARAGHRHGGRLRTRHWTHLLPDGRRVVGANLTPSRANLDVVQTEGPAQQVFAELWVNWDLDWVTTCLDHAVSLDANLIRCIGSVYAVHAGRIARSAYLDRWSELSALCQERNIYLMGVGCDGEANAQDGTQVVPRSAQRTEIVAWAARMATLPNVPALGLISEEAPAYVEGADGLALYQAVKAVTDLPLGFSSHLTTTSQVTAGFRADRADVVLLNVYYEPGAADLDANYWPTASRPLLVTEFGADSGMTVPAQQARYDAVAGLHSHVAANGRRTAGSVAWSLRDYGAPGQPSNDWGLYDKDGAEKAHLTAIFRALPKV